MPIFVKSIFMPRHTHIILPRLQRILTGMGENIKLARKRRKLGTALVAARAGISRPTLNAIEKGDPNVSIGRYLKVLLALGLENDFALIAKDDVFGRKLQDIALLSTQKDNDE
jgi:transcriptional regulator with XRE-family HTH domain